MIAYDLDVHIGRPVQDVFRFFADLEKQPMWERGFLSVSKLTDGPLQAGTRYAYVHRLPIGRQRGTIHILACEPPIRISMRADGGAIIPQYMWSFAPDGRGTRMRQEFRATVRGPLRLLTPLLTRQFRKDSQQALIEAKRQIENGNDAAP